MNIQFGTTHMEESTMQTVHQLYRQVHSNKKKTSIANDQVTWAEDNYKLAAKQPDGWQKCIYMVVGHTNELSSQRGSSSGGT